MLLRLTEPEISIFTFGLLEIKLFIIAGVKLSNRILEIFKFETVSANLSVFASTTTILSFLIALVIKSSGFDGRGNYTLGITEQIIFPEIDIDKVNKISGMDITFVTSASTDNEAKSLLSLMGLPFKKN